MVAKVKHLIMSLSSIGGSSSSIDGDNDGACPRSIWNAVQSICPGNEANEIKRVIGDSLIEESHDLHSEVTTLLEIWRQMREESIPNGSFHGDATPFQLSEPPGVRDKLIQEVKFLATYLRERDVRSPTLSDSTTSTIINYALVQQGKERPSTPCDRNITDSPLRNHSSSMATSSNTWALMEGDVNISDIDKLVNNLRDAVKEEITQRMNDIKLIQVISTIM
jgi:hypothetical protein